MASNSIPSGTGCDGNGTNTQQGISTDGDSDVEHGGKGTRTETEAGGILASETAGASEKAAERTDATPGGAGTGAGSGVSVGKH